MNHDPQAWGRPRDDLAGPYDWSIANAASAMPHAHTQEPIVTGTSVIAIKFDKGVIIAADNLASYGSLARFTDQERLFQVGSSTVLGVSGEISDLQFLQRYLKQLEIQEGYDGALPEGGLTTGAVYSYLSKFMYNRRNEMNPLWNSILVAGFEDGKPLLSYVDLLGVTYSSPCAGTGFGAHMAVPLLRKLVDKDSDAENVTEAQARAAIDESMKVLFYRDCNALDKYSVATITAEGVKFEKDVRCKDMKWAHAKSTERSN